MSRLSCSLSLLPVLLSLLLSFVPSPSLDCLENGLLRTPPMGINSWTAVGSLVSEAFLLASGDTLIKTGLAKLGYIYVNSDDGWDTLHRSTEPPYRLVADALKFPSGIGGLSSALHSRSPPLRLGIYGASSSVVCSGRPGSLFMEDVDAETYAEWGVDFVKQDNCGEYAYGNAKFQIFADAINRTGKFIAISTEPFTLVPSPIPSMFSNLWRTGNDIEANYEVIVDRLDRNSLWSPFVGPGSWADPDLIQCGNGGLTEAECRTHFGIAAVMKAPLILGTDVIFLNASMLSIVGNADVISVNQDPLGQPATKRLINDRPVAYPVALAPCQTQRYVNNNNDDNDDNDDDEVGVNGVSRKTLRWELRPIVIDDVYEGETRDKIIQTWRAVHESSLSSSLVNVNVNVTGYSIYHPLTSRCLSSHVHRGDGMRVVPVLLPCNSADVNSVWILSKPNSLTAIINANSGLALTVSSSTVYGSTHGDDSVPLLDSAYGISNLTFTTYVPPPVCTSRACDDYDPLSTFYVSPVTKQVHLALFTANAYRCFAGDASCYQLTKHYPTTSDFCLTQVLSISNDGLDVGVLGVHVWSGRLSDVVVDVVRPESSSDVSMKSFVVAVENRNDVQTPPLTNVTVRISELELDREMDAKVEEMFFCVRFLFSGVSLSVPVSGSGFVVFSSLSSHDSEIARLTQSSDSSQTCK